MVAQAIAKGLTALAARGGKEAGEVAAKQVEASPLRQIFDALPEERVADIPKQPDNTGLFGYHGSAKGRLQEEGKEYFDMSFGNPNDQFMGEGFYFTIDPRMAEEYANLRATKDFQPMTRPDPNRPGKRKDTGEYINPKTKEKATLASLMRGVDIEGNPLLAGQNISRFDLGVLSKPFIVNNNKQRLYAKENIEKLKEEGYDSIIFRDFEDRSQQILVFPEYIGKVAGKTTKKSEELIPQKIFSKEPDAIGNMTGSTDKYSSVEMIMDKKKFDANVENLPKSQIKKDSVEYLTKALKNNKPVAQPFITLKWDGSTWKPQKGTHEGRHRVIAAEKVFGKDVKFPVNVQLRTKNGSKVPIEELTGRKNFYKIKDQDEADRMLAELKKFNISDVKKKRGGSVVERNPYNYLPKAI
jgi:hypothetical protein